MSLKVGGFGACMDECCCDDDARAEVFRYEECPFRHPYTSVSSSVDRKSGTYAPLLLDETTANGCHAYRIEIQSV